MKSTGNRHDDDGLLDRAVGTFRRLGYPGATMAILAEDADSTKPTLYAHFGGKEDLYVRAFAREIDRLKAVLFTTYADAESFGMREAVEADMLAFFDYARTFPDSFHLIFSEEPRPATAAALREIMIEQLIQKITGQIRRRLQSGGADVLGRSAEVLASLLVGIAIRGGRIAVDTGLAPAALGDLVVSLVSDGLFGLTYEPLRRIDEATNDDVEERDE
ncbi:TetR/AcrR family transcriptional regulator [Gordonia sp. DT30]|uniref:TetR/AcrR family transcriptional regulator n=1 Tax=unclassified Gordonia (in: high G+C Gram-positive bacteria) TaxID=2657482 RepID=UPI003CEFECC7